MPADLRAPRQPPRRPQRRRPTLSLATVLALAIGFLVLVSTGAVLLVTGGALVRNTVDLLQRRAELGLDLAESRLRGHLDPAAEQVAYLSRLTADGLFDPFDESRPQDDRMAVAAGALAASPQVLGLGFWPASLDALTIAVRDFETGSPVAILEDDPPAFLNEIDAATRAQTGPQWGDLVFVQEIGAAGLTVRQPLRRLDRYLGGVAAVVSARELSRLVIDLDIGVEGSRAFLLHGEDAVLAHPFLVMTDRPVGGEVLGRVLLPPLDALGDPVLAMLFAADRDAQAFDDGISEIVEIDLTGNDDPDFLILTRAIPGYAPEPLILGLILPIGSVDAEVQRMVVAGGVGLGVLTLSIVLAILFGRRLARPMGRHARYADAVARLDFDDLPPLPRSRLTEIDAQARAFNTLLSAMRWFQLYVPKSLVNRLMRQDQDGPGGPTEGQARVLTVMFTDIAGFTAASQHLNERAVAGWLNRHFSVLAAAVEETGGTIDKFMGDGMMAFWGAPDPQTDHAARACRAALAIAEAVAAENPRLIADGLPPIRLRVGIHTGRVVVGNIGAPDRLNFTIVGDAVNVGNRLETLARDYGTDATPVTVLVSEAVRERAGQSFDFEALGDLGLRGRDGVLSVCRLTVG